MEDECRAVHLKECLVDPGSVYVRLSIRTPPPIPRLAASASYELERPLRRDLRWRRGDPLPVFLSCLVNQSHLSLRRRRSSRSREVGRTSGSDGRTARVVFINRLPSSPLMQRVPKRVCLRATCMPVCTFPSPPRMQSSECAVEKKRNAL